MKPLKIAILWHQHQPDYKLNGEFILPWTRFHAVKDYYDLPEVLHEFPEIKQTFNIVPSLNLQIFDYINGVKDRVQKLSLKNAKDLTDEDKLNILEQFFICHVEKLVKPYPRYKKLYETARDKDVAMKEFDEQDWRDLQMWYNLTWFGYYSRQPKSVARFFQKGENFTENEKKIVLDLQDHIMKEIMPQYSHLREIGQIEVSVTPMYHPILPLLCDSKVMHEAMPESDLPDPLFQYPQDADAQINKACDHFREIFNDHPAGMWPSEGSVSDKTLELIAKNGLRWTASDEEVLARSFDYPLKSTEKYFPRKYKSKEGDIAVFFRDHFLSDRIGFTYSQWDPFDAANDFCHHLHQIRNRIIDEFGDDALEHAVVPVILDGENCWEYYRENGVPFLRQLYGQIGNDKLFKTVTLTEAAAPNHTEFLEPMEHIHAGSWINANFRIWMGHPEHIQAWSMLSKARRAVEDKKDEIGDEKYNEAMNELYISEGSDWFWWYGDEHQAENQKDFDMIFRGHLQNAWEIIGEEIPEDVKNPVSGEYTKERFRGQTGEVHPRIDGRISPEPEWENAGYYDAVGSMGTMHQVGELFRRLWYARDEKNLYLRCDTVHQMKRDEQIELRFHAPKEFTIIIRKNYFEIHSGNGISFNNVRYGSDEVYELAVTKEAVFNGEDSKTMELEIITKTAEGEIKYPKEGKIKLEF